MPNALLDTNTKDHMRIVIFMDYFKLFDVSYMCYITPGGMHKFTMDYNLFLRLEMSLTKCID